MTIFVRVQSIYISRCRIDYFNNTNERTFQGHCNEIKPYLSLNFEDFKREIESNGSDIIIFDIETLSIVVYHNLNEKSENYNRYKINEEVDIKSRNKRDVILTKYNELNEKLLIEKNEKQKLLDEPQHILIHFIILLSIFYYLKDNIEDYFRNNTVILLITNDEQKKKMVIYLFQFLVIFWVLVELFPNVIFNYILFPFFNVEQYSIGNDIYDLENTCQLSEIYGLKENFNPILPEDIYCKDIPTYRLSYKFCDYTIGEFDCLDTFFGTYDEVLILIMVLRVILLIYASFIVLISKLLTINKLFLCYSIYFLSYIFVNQLHTLTYFCICNHVVLFLGIFSSLAAYSIIAYKFFPNLPKMLKILLALGGSVIGFVTGLGLILLTLGFFKIPLYECRILDLYGFTAYEFFSIVFYGSLKQTYKLVFSLFNFED